MDSLRQALAKVAQQSTERALKLQSATFSGLPSGLAPEGSPDGGIIAITLNYIGAARMGSLMAAAAPVFLHYVGHTSDGVEDLTSLLPLSITQTQALLDRAWEVAALEMAIAVWAIARRGLAPPHVGAGPRAVYEAILPMLHIGAEGTRIFQMAPIVELVRHGDLVGKALTTHGRG